jgi:hypothetical protein
MQPNDIQTILILFDSNFHTKFNVWDRVQLFLHARLSESKNKYVCENNESDHKLAKKYPMKDCGFDIWDQVLFVDESYLRLGDDNRILYPRYGKRSPNVEM